MIGNFNGIINHLLYASFMTFRGRKYVQYIYKHIRVLDDKEKTQPSYSTAYDLGNVENVDNV